MRHYHQKRLHHKAGFRVPHALHYARRLAAGGAAALALALMAVSVAGCAMSVPIAMLSDTDSTAAANATADARSTAGDDVTGSIPGSALERLLQPEDWRRAKAALATALDPQGDGSMVAWDNPRSGVGGSFAPTGKPYASDEKICRRFGAKVERKAGVRAMQGVACADRSGAWTIAELAATPLTAAN